MTVRHYEQRALRQLAADHSALTIAEPWDMDSYNKVPSLSKYLQMGLILVCFMIGCLAAPIAFQTGNDQQLNIFWLLIVLLGTHFLSLLLWGLSLLRRPASNQYYATWFTIMLKRVGHLLGVSEPAVTYFIRLRFSQPVGTWHLGRIVHSAWSGYLLGGLVSALLFLMTHQVQFVWETTLLTQADFSQLTHAIGTVPAWFGIPAPSLNDIAASQIGTALQPDTTRKSWAVWILSCVLIYGVAVRLILTIGCHYLYRHQREALWRSLIPTAIAKTQVQSKIIDADQTPKQPNVHSYVDRELTNAKPSPAKQYFLFEWSRAVPSGFSQDMSVFTLNHSQAQQDYLEDQHIGRIIVIDTEVSPDRGSLRFIQQAQAGTEGFYLYGDRFIDRWSQALQQQGVPFEQIARLAEH